MILPCTPRIWIQVLCICVVTVFSQPRVYGSSPQDFHLVEVADGIYVHSGSHVDIEHSQRGDSANIGFIVGTKCVAVVDTGGAIVTGRKLRSAIQERSAMPICYVINTHVHFDHVLGNAAFTDPNIEFVGHRNLSPAMASNREFFAEQFSQELDHGSIDSVIVPTKTVDREMTLDLGDRVLRLQAHPTAHTNADLTVFDEKTSTLWTGDLIFMERLPVLDGSLKGWLAWLEKFQAKSIARIIPGHGPASALWPEAGMSQRQYLQALLTDGREAISQGVFLEDAIESMSRDAAANWLLNARHPRNVSKAYRELEWE